jgi:hypothetical protein
MTTVQLSVNGVGFDAQVLLPCVRGTWGLKLALHDAYVMLSREFKSERAGTCRCKCKNQRTR